MAQDIKPLIRQYIRLVGPIYPGQIPFTNCSRLKAEQLHDQVRNIEFNDPAFKFPAKSWQEHLDSVKEQA